jgi:hypothetical protein
MSKPKKCGSWLVCLLAVCRFASFGQDTAAYEVLVSKASLCHLQKHYVEGLAYYEQAFALRQPDALDAYKAAALYALDSNGVKAFIYLHLALDKGWTDAAWLAADPYFDCMKQTAPTLWQEALQDAVRREQGYSRHLRLPRLRQQINHLALNDQGLRNPGAMVRPRRGVGFSADPGGKYRR